MRIVALTVLLLAGAAAASPRVYVTVDGARTEHVRSRLVAALDQRDARSFDVTIESSVATRGHAAEVTVHAKAVVSDTRGIRSLISVSASVRGNARSSARLVAQATEGAIKSIAQRARATEVAGR